MEKLHKKATETVPRIATYSVWEDWVDDIISSRDEKLLIELMQKWLENKPDQETLDNFKILINNTRVSYTEEFWNLSLYEYIFKRVYHDKIDLVFLKLLMEFGLELNKEEMDRLTLFIHEKLTSFKDFVGFSLRKM
jgi:hypothetical protein